MKKNIIIILFCGGILTSNILAFAQNEFGETKETFVNAVAEDPYKLLDSLITRVKEHTDQPVTSNILFAIAEDMGVDTSLINDPNATRIKRMVEYLKSIGMSDSEVEAFKNYVISNPSVWVN
jgi:hypothetical protein